MIQRYTAHYDVLDKVVRYAESREGLLVLSTAHFAEMKRVKDVLREAERLLTELYPSDIYSDAHEAEYYAVNVVINKAQAILAEED